MVTMKQDLLSAILIPQGNIFVMIVIVFSLNFMTAFLQENLSQLLLFSNMNFNPNLLIMINVLKILVSRVDINSVYSELGQH